MESFQKRKLGTYNRIFANLERIGTKALLKENFKAKAIRFSRSIDLRYEWQSHHLQVPVPGRELDENHLNQISNLFHTLHERNFGHKRNSKVQSVHLRVRSVGELPKPTMTRFHARHGLVTNAKKGLREVYLGNEGFVPFRVYDRAKLTCGVIIKGPAIVEEETSTTLIRAKDSLIVDRFGNLEITIGNWTSRRECEKRY